MSTYYNEIDPFCCEWLRNLMAAGHIATGEIDSRSIVEVQPDDVRGFTRCHFFAGLGGWDYALRLAGWPDARPVWTGSCPCQPFSAAGKREGHQDERHLWPAWFRLIGECRPATVFGEQVAGADGLAWLDVVLAEMEGIGYAVAAADLPATGVGAPHIRQRLYFVADRASDGRREERQDGGGSAAGDRTQGWAAGLESGSVPCELADADRGGCVGRDSERICVQGTSECRTSGELADAERCWSGAWRASGADGTAALEPDRHSATCGMVHTASERPERGTSTRRETWNRIEQRGGSFWSNVDWIACRDGKARPTFARAQLVADGLSAGLAAGGTGETEEVNGTTSVAGSGAELRGMWEGAGAQALQRGSGGPDAIRQAVVLRSGVHGARDDGRHQGAEREEQQAAIRPGGRADMRGLWHYIAASCPSSGREPDEQRSIESRDVVRALSHAKALAALEGDDATTEALLALRETCEALGPVQHTLDSLSAAWRRACSEGQGRRRVGLGAWRTCAASPLAFRRVSGRVGILRGAGNAIVAPLAAEVIAAFMECRP